MTEIAAFVVALAVPAVAAGLIIGAFKVGSRG